MNMLVGLNIIQVHLNVHTFLTRYVVGVRVFSFFKCKGKNAHSNQVATMDSFEWLSDHCLNSLQVRALGCPIPAWPWSILLASENYQLLSFLLVFLSSIEDVHHLPSGHVDSLWTNLTLHHFVDYSDVGESSSCHDKVVASPWPIGVKVLLLDTLFLQEPRCRRVDGYVASRWNVVSSDWISEHSKNVSWTNWFEFL